MKVELEIKRILSSPSIIDKKVSTILKLVKWDKKKLKQSIEKHGTSSDQRRSMIIKDFWGKK
ncbi:hypothetical protein KAT51_01000 [bacterium]|nr:hypothetical protein [bacterium]